MIVSMIIRMGSADIESFVEIRLFLFCESANFSPPAGLDLIVIQCWVPARHPASLSICGVNLALFRRHVAPVVRRLVGY